MILYNVTANVNKDVAHNWLRYMKLEHIPDVMATGCFKAHRILKLTDPEPEEGVTYAIQYVCDSMEVLENYFEKYAPSLRQEPLQKFPNQFVVFRTILEEV
jgi:hypothetical protein